MSARTLVLTVWLVYNLVTRMKYDYFTLNECHFMHVLVEFVVFQRGVGHFRGQFQGERGVAHQ